MTDDITVVSTGDLYLNRDNPETAFDALDSQLVTADLRIGNLEAVITDTGSPLGSPPHIRSPLNTIEALTRFDILSFANNHAMDFGPEALTDTIDTLTAEGISVVGAGVTKTASETPSIIDTRGGRVGCVAFEATRISSGFLMQASENRPGMNTVSVVPTYPEPYLSRWDLNKVDEVVGRASAAVDVLFAAFHFGESLDRTLTVPQITLARRAIEAGADAVIGSHPHVLQAIEIYGSAPIFYSLGHLVFDSITEFGFPYPADKMFPPASAASGLVNFTISSGTITAVSLRPTIIDHENTPRLIHESDAAFESHVQPVVSQSRERGTRIDLDDQTLRIQLE